MSVKSIDTRQTEALERIARTMEEFPNTPLRAILRCLEIQGQQAANAKDNSVLDGWPALPFEVEYPADRDDLDRYITVRIKNESGVYFVFSESGYLLDANTTKY